MISSSNTSSKKRVRIGLLGLYGWGNLGDAAIQEATMQNIKLRIAEAEFVGLSLNPDDTQKRHGIAAYPIASYWEHFQKHQESAEKKTSNDGSVLKKLGSIGWYANLKRILEGSRLVRFPYTIVRSIWHRLSKIITELRFFCRILKRVRSLDLLLFSGGGLLDEYWGGPWQHPFTVFRWAIAAKLVGVKTVVLSVGYSRKGLPATQRLLRYALRSCDYRSLREEDSRRLVRSINVPEPNHVFPDLAFSLKRPVFEKPPIPASLAGVIGLSPIAWMDPRAWPEKDATLYQNYVRIMTETIKQLKGLNYQIKIFASDIHMDFNVVEDIAYALGIGHSNQASQVQIVRVTELSQLLEIISSCDIVVAARLHGILLSYVMGKPVLGLTYDPKVERHMKEMDQEDYFLEIDKISTDQIISLLEKLRYNSQSVIDQVDAKIAARRTLLDNQYDDILSLVGYSGSRESTGARA